MAKVKHMNQDPTIVTASQAVSFCIEQCSLGGKRPQSSTKAETEQFSHTVLQKLKLNNSRALSD